MKYLKLLPLAALFLFSFQCNDDRNGSCGRDVICTMDFRSVGITVTDKDGKGVKLDEAYTVRQSTGDVIRDTQPVNDNGVYNVLSDNYQKELQNQRDIFTFIGMLNGAEVVRESFTISADCCHIDYVDGNREVTIN